MANREWMDIADEMFRGDAKKVSAEYRRLHPSNHSSSTPLQKSGDRRRGVLKMCCTVLASILILYLFGFDVYMAYKTSGVVASIATLVFAPLSFFVWFLIVLFNNGVNAYCVAWIVAVVLSVIATMKNR